MRIDSSKIVGHVVFEPVVHSDARGHILESFTCDAFENATGSQFPLAQTMVSASGVGVLRGIHFATPPVRRWIYVTCLTGAVYDVTVDLRVGSQTFGESVAVALSASSPRSVAIAPGLGHGFVALAPDTKMLYLSSARYSPDNEHSIDAFDPALCIDWPRQTIEGQQIEDIIRSDRDARAMSLDGAARQGLLPSWSESTAQGDNELSAMAAKPHPYQHVKPVTVRDHEIM